MQRTATCLCGQASVTVTGEPVLVTACNCTCCQRRSGSVFSVASRWTVEQIASRRGELSSFERVGSSDGVVRTSFCPTCGSTIVTHLAAMPDVIGIPVGAFADPRFPPPQVVVWCDEQAEWMEFPEGMVRLSDQSQPVTRA